MTPGADLEKTISLSQTRAVEGTIQEGNSAPGTEARGSPAGEPAAAEGQDQGPRRRAAAQSPGETDTGQTAKVFISVRVQTMEDCKGQKNDLFCFLKKTTLTEGIINLERGK